MAVMWPKTLPLWVTQDPRRAAECAVYKKLDLVLDDTWSVYYSRPWWGLNHTGGEIDGEADFIIAHPDLGVLFIEVKGGQVSHDPVTSQWKSRDRMGITHKIKDPMQQAQKSKHQLIKKFQARPGWPSMRVRLRHGVIFPDCQPDNADPIAGYEQALFCFSTDLRDRLRTWVVQRLSSHVGTGFDQESGPGRDGISAINSVIAAPANLKVPLHRQLESDVAQQDVLMTGAQLHTLVSIDAYDRVVVEGGAGTGKTVIACELAARYVEDGKKVLLCCLSEVLAASLRHRMDTSPCLDIRTIPELRTDARTGNKRYNAVIVDEGQDVDWADWDLLEHTLLPDGLLRVLFDSNQAVYRMRDDLETRLQAKGISLQLNLRNTQRIASVTESLYSGPLIQCAGAKGEVPVVLDTAAAATTEDVVTCVQELVHGQSLAPGDVTVLVQDAESAAEIRESLQSARLKATDALSRLPDAVVVETIARFKGLESLVVIILANRVSANATELSYVAVSRARALLAVIGPVTGTLLGEALMSVTDNPRST